MPKPDFTSTMSALDALVGATDEEKQREEEAKADDAAFAEAERARREKEGASTSADDSDGVTLTVAPGVLEVIEQAEKARKSGSVPEDVESFGGKPKGETEGAKEGKKIQVTLDDKAVKQMMDKDSWLDNVVEGLSESAARERDERTPEENAKLDKVLADLSDLAKKDKGERSATRFAKSSSRSLRFWRSATSRGAQGGHGETQEGGVRVQHLLGDGHRRSRRGDRRRGRARQG